MSARNESSVPSNRVALTARPARAATLLLALMAVAGPGADGGTAGDDGGLRPFKAEFALEWRGMNAASASLELTRQAGGHYTYVSRNNARGVFRAVLPGELTQTSRLLVESGQVRPLSYRGDDGSPDQRRDVALDFDWERQRVTGTAETKPVDLALQSGIQDIMSVQIALIVDLLGGRKPSMYTLVDKNRIKEYLYSDDGTARLDTALGPLDTVIWSSRRPGSDRVTRVWYAPSLGYAPVRAERRDGDKLEWAMRLVSLQR
jgi:Protein of unknown function (DUF3108)